MKNPRFFLPLLLAICFFSCQTNAATKIYVSSSEGNDRNSGTSALSPLKTLSYALKKGDEIYLKRGDIFYGNIELTNKSLYAYGTGARPILSGFKRPVKPKWKKKKRNVWRIDLSADNFSGVDTQGSSRLNNIGCIYEYDKGLIRGRKVEHLNDLKEDWDFWQDLSKANDPKQFDDLYLYSKKNPNNLNLEFSIGVSGVTMKNATIDGIEIRGFGRHGIAAHSHTVIRNCRIDAIGGTVQVDYPRFTCLGNGIEFWVASKEGIEDGLVEGCWVSRCYDCGMTIQGYEKSPYTAKDVMIRDNMISECCYGWEDFLNNGKQFKNCVFKNNIVVNNGNVTGFGYPSKRFFYCNVLGHNHRVKNEMILENNTFIGGNYYSASPENGYYGSNIWRNNTFITSLGHWLLAYFTGERDVIWLPKAQGRQQDIDKATEKAIQQYRKRTSDSTTNFIFKSEEEVRTLIQQYKLRFITSHQFAF